LAIILKFSHQNPFFSAFCNKSFSDIDFFHFITSVIIIRVMAAHTMDLQLTFVDEINHRETRN
ncbi:hypothetical protein ABES33_29890, partial [Bacillus pseudomycoides]|uniref:hypothetical protein n=1 Tax=Bacillus pseudomycoides TaxID=64104 RepID=UPI003D1C2FEA